jgi:hypothetical protein
VTDVSEIQHLVDGYRRWLKDRTSVKSVHPDWVEVTTPFLDRHNDYIQLYVRSVGDHYELTDDGSTIRDLEASGCSLDTAKRQELLKMTLSGFAVELRGDQLFTKATASNFSFRKHAMIQSILAVSDLFYLAESTVRSLFKEDVERWLRSSGIRFIQNVSFVGKSGYQQNFDFVIPEFGDAPERIMRAISNPNRMAVMNFVVAWTDTIETRPPKSKAIALLNDNDKPISESVIGALENYNPAFPK